MKKITFKRPVINQSTGQPYPQKMVVYPIGSDGHINGQQRTMIPINVGDSYLIKDNTVTLVELKPSSSGGTFPYKNSYWVLLNPLSGNKKYAIVNSQYDVASIDRTKNKNKDKVETITAFDGIDLSNTENLDSGFDGFFN